MFLFSLQNNMIMLDDETLTVEQAGIEDSQQILIEGNEKKKKKY